MRDLRTFEEVQQEYYRERPEEIDEFIDVAVDEHAIDGDTGALLSALRMATATRSLS